MKIPGIRLLLSLLTLSLSGPASRAQTPPDQWIVAVAPSLRQAIEPLARQRQEQGMKAIIVQTSDVLSADEIRAGNALHDDAEALRAIFVTPTSPKSAH